MGRFLVRRLMREQNLVAIQPRAYRPQTTDSGHGLLASPNLLKDPKNQPKSWGECVVGDITYVPTRTGWAYLAMFQDKRTKRLVGWAISDSLEAGLVVSALQMALRRGLIKRGCIVHTDRGSQYVSDAFRSLLKRCRLRQSMSAKGNCYDNAQAESFFSRFKTELIEGGVFASLEEARSEIFTYIEGFYNPHRLHSTLGYLTPIEFDHFLRIDNQDLLNQILNQPVKRRRAMLASILSRNNRPKSHQQMSRGDLNSPLNSTPQNLLIDFPCLKNANLKPNSTKRSETIVS
jgi:transposase InsO family protein